MDSKQIWANLAIADVNRTAAFYSALGCTPNGKPTAEIASFLFAANKLVIHFFLREKLEKARALPQPI